MKTERQAAIRSLIREQAIRTQDEMANALRNMGYQVTQATVSRDIREMRLVKIASSSGGYRYGEPEAGWNGLDERLTRLLRDCVLSAEAAGQIIVVKTMSGAAGTAAEALDSLEMPEIIGSIAGDNTMFLAARDHASAQSAGERILALIM